jgi:hypothetical protein
MEENFCVNASRRQVNTTPMTSMRAIPCSLLLMRRTPVWEGIRKKGNQCQSEPLTWEKVTFQFFTSIWLSWIAIR